MNKFLGHCSSLILVIYDKALVSLGAVSIRLVARLVDINRCANLNPLV